MASKDTAAGFDYLVTALKADKSAAYGDLRQKAEAKGLTVYPIMFGRAKALLGLVKSAKRGKGKAAKAKAAQKRGPGRPKGGGESKSGRIRELLRSGMSAGEIAKKVGCSLGLVYNVKSTSGKGSGRAATRRGPGRPRGSVARRASGSNGMSDVVAALQEQAREREKFRRAIEKIRELVAAVG